MPARPFSPTEITLLESHLLQHGRYRDRMLILAGTQVGYRITELLAWTVSQVLGVDGDIVREVTVTRADLKGGKGAHKRSVRSHRVVLTRPECRDTPTRLHWLQLREKGERERPREPQPRLVVAKVPLNQPSRDAQKQDGNGEHRYRDGMRIVQPLAHQNVGYWGRFHHCL
jgi:hypothetical protein